MNYTEEQKQNILLNYSSIEEYENIMKLLKNLSKVLIFMLSYDTIVHTNKNGQQDDQIRVLDKAYQSKESAWDNISDVDRKTLESYAKSADLSYEELEGYTNALKENNKIIETNKEKQMELASVVARQEKALDKAKNSYKDWMKILNNADSTTQEQTAVLEEMRETYEDLFDLTENEETAPTERYAEPIGWGCFTFVQTRKNRPA